MPIERHLLLVHQSRAQDVADFVQIAERVRLLAPEIDVFTAENSLPSSMVRKKAALRRTLVFSPGPLDRFRPARGRIYCGRLMSKLKEMALLSAGGANVPAFVELTPELRLDPDVFGEYVVIKPTHPLAASFSRGIEVNRAGNVVYRQPQTYDRSHPGRYGPMMVQRLIDTGPQRTFFRVLTLFGTVLSAHREDSTVPLPSVETCDYPSDYKIRPDFALGGQLSYTHDPEILGFARGVYRAMPDIPLQGVDIIRCHRTGMLYVLEINPGGNTWTFSRPQAANTRRLLGVDDLSKEFDAWNAAAAILVEKTRAEAE